MYLRVLNEIQYGSMKGCYSWDINSIIKSWMNLYFKTTLSEEEKQLTFEAVQELKTSGLIARDSTQYVDDFQKLTAKGKNLVDKQQDPDIFGLRLEEILKDDELLTRCAETFNNGNYETAVFNAFKLVEEKVRIKAGLNASDIGVDLMTKAFNSRNGVLVIPTCTIPAEQEGVHSLFRGAIAFFKNPCSHRTVNYDDRLSTIQTIAFAELLLKIISTAKLR
jgi:uncharacterized protein (TIGR02391 family)